MLEASVAAVEAASSLFNVFTARVFAENFNKRRRSEGWWTRCVRRACRRQRRPCCSLPSSSSSSSSSHSGRPAVGARRCSIGFSRCHPVVDVLAAGGGRSISWNGGERAGPLMFDFYACLFLPPSALYISSRPTSRNAQISVFEATQETWQLPLSQRRPDATRCVKKYRRSAAGGGVRSFEGERPRDLSDLRNSVDFLLGFALFDEARFRGGNVSSAVSFITDRLRAVQVDVVTNRLLSEPSCGHLLRKMMRFYILVSYVLCAVPPPQFEDRFNMQGRIHSAVLVHISSQPICFCDAKIIQLLACLLTYRAANTVRCSSSVHTADAKKPPLG